MANNRRPKPPVQPRSTQDPTGSDALERSAIRDFNARMKKIARGYKALLARIPARPVVNQRYEFQLDAQSLRQWLAEGDLLVDNILLEGGQDELWFFRGYVEIAAARGMAQQFANLARQSDAYKAERVSAQAVLNTPPYRRRLALLGAREFEEMRGLAQDVKTNMGRILTDGMGRGKNPLDIARSLTERLGIEGRRARRIARTEITTALRRARMDEADDAAEELGLETREMHFSALSPTTRATHAARHGTLHTTDEQRDWWSKDGNSINCKCTTISVMVDSDGRPLVPTFQARARAALRKAREKGNVQ